MDNTPGESCRRCTAPADPEDELGICRECGRVHVQLGQHDPGSPPSSVEIVEGASEELRQDRDPYRSAEVESDLTLVLTHRQHTLNTARFVGVWAACAVVWRGSLYWAKPNNPMDAGSSQLEHIIAIIILLTGVIIIAAFAIPKLTRTRIRVTRTSLLIGREGVPERRHGRVHLDEIEAVVARCESPAERDSDLRFEVVCLDPGGRVLARLSNLYESATARWLANRLEDALGFEA